MNTKTCKHCGWVYPITQPGKVCVVCGAPFDLITCDKCKQPTPLDKMEKGTYTCKACASAHDVLVKARRRQMLDDQFNGWLDKIKQVPKSYPTLTEEQWLEACQFFDGCARCGSKDIDTRGFFVGSELGGRYCDWNVIPVCERCAAKWNLSKSAFKYIEKADSNARSRTYRDCLSKILEYLGGKLDAATRTSEATSSSTADSECRDSQPSAAE